MAVTKKELWRMLNTTDSGLMAHVIEDILELHGDSDEEVNAYLDNVYTYGGISGAITSLIYHKDCSEFVKEHLEEVLEIYNDAKEFIDPKEEINADYLAWMAYQTCIYIILSEQPVADFHM